MAMRNGGRLAASLGPDDPRARRFANALATPENLVSAPIVVSPEGTITLKPAAAVATPSATTQSSILDFSGGTAGTPATINSTGGATADDNFATLATEMNNLISRMNALESSVRRLVLVLRDGNIMGT
jgi:hypothetical protein